MKTCVHCRGTEDAVVKAGTPQHAICFSPFDDDDYDDDDNDDDDDNI